MVVDYYSECLLCVCVCVCVCVMWMGRGLMLLSQSSFQQCMTVEFVTVNNGCQFRLHPLSERHYFTCATKNSTTSDIYKH